MICTKVLRRMESCSLHGLLAYLRALFSTLTEHDALWYLLVSNIDAASAVAMAEQHGHVMSGAYQEAYRNAAMNSWHPDPDALSKLTMSLRQMELVELSFLLSNGRALSNSEVKQLGVALSALFEEQVSPMDHAEILSVNQKRFISDIGKKFQDDQEFFASKVNASLNNYAKKNGGHFEIHVICGVNPNISKRARSHINFWATPKGGTTPILFFAECSNDADAREEEESLCFSVPSASIDSVRCFDCEYHGIKIVHPCDEVYHGHGSGEDFNLIARGEHSISNERVISACQFHIEAVFVLDEDWIYFDPKLDARIAERNAMDDGDFRIWRSRAESSEASCWMNPTDDCQNLL
ncbi:unnamed protein product [Urochloa humidicola]